MWWRIRFWSTLIIILIISSKTVISNRTNDASIFRDTGRLTGSLLRTCLLSSDIKSLEMIPVILRDCLQRHSLMVLDKMIDKEVVTLSNGVALLKYRKDAQKLAHRSKNGNLTHNEQRLDWKSRLIQKIGQLFQTHILKINLNSLDVSPTIEGRGRRKNNMFTHLLMFGIISAGFIVIPMGFQFLAILGGKALLLAKMALILASIQGLKKIATSNVNYGLYSTHGSQGPCKREGLNFEDSQFNTDDVHFIIQFENERQYDRRWPTYEGENHGITTYGNQDSHADILHPRELWHET